ncbi:serine hydrolase domain-containing protein [Paenibacillus piri]|uniref:Class C beta-lactamase-related serine hydrolase n=1 Tax=Paenibacillus piri TaxID=2547395 RepID=A0A4R5L0D0_9BACL|nr:serine hydrolase [Paenibacillus piri]TDG00801.1 class C beta-lactamase-related serine hydrolase [Paenibacillus piri]
MAAENQLLRSTPEELGIASASVLTFLEAVERQGLELHGFMLLRHGRVAAEGWWAPYGPRQPHMLFSLSKSFTSTAVGFAVSEDRLSLDDSVIGFFPEAVPDGPVDPLLAAMRVKHLLTMSAGHAKPIMGAEWRRTDGDWVRYFLQRPMDHQPGSRFVYNSGATYMLSAIVQKATGQRLLDYLQPRLFQPLGIDVAGWDSCPSGIDAGGWGLSLRTEDLARFGQFYLQRGMWDGRQLLPASWVAEATARQIGNGSADGRDPLSDSQQGYGYQFWRSRHGAYRADGAFGQLCLVMPKQSAVIAIHGGLSNMQAVLRLVWEHLLPAMGDGPLPRDEQSQTMLLRKLRSLNMLPPQAQSHSAVAAQVSGRRYMVEDNADGVQSVLFDFGADGCTFTLSDYRGEHRIRCGIGEWQEGGTTMSGRSLHHQYEPPALRVAASGTWHDADTYVMTWCFVETPFTDTVICRFYDDRLVLERSVNVNSESRERPPLHGKQA